MKSFGQVNHDHWNSIILKHIFLIIYWSTFLWCLVDKNALFEIWQCKIFSVSKPRLIRNFIQLNKSFLKGFLWNIIKSHFWVHKKLVGNSSSDCCSSSYFFWSMDILLENSLNSQWFCGILLIHERDSWLTIMKGFWLIIFRYFGPFSFIWRIIKDGKINEFLKKIVKFIELTVLNFFC